MKLEGRVEVHAPRPKVWALLTDPVLIAPCLPGVESVEKLEGGRFAAHASVRFGFINLGVVVNAEFSDLREPDEATVIASGRASGSTVDAIATMALADGPHDSTVVDWTADVTMAGMIASVGAQMLDGAFNKVIAETFDCIKARLEA
jgi:carbon monoxide dehydrogenase subunit G